MQLIYHRRAGGKNGKQGARLASTVLNGYNIASDVSPTLVAINANTQTVDESSMYAYFIRSCSRLIQSTSLARVSPVRRGEGDPKRLLSPDE